MRVWRWWVLLATAVPAFGIWSPVGTPVPIERVLTNVQTQLRDHPNDASAWLVLGRLHSYAFFSGKPEVPMNGANLFIRNIPQAPRPSEPSAADLGHLKESILAFRKAIELKRSANGAVSSLPFLGLGWDLEQGARYAERMDSTIPGDPHTPAPAAYWLDRALDNYRQAYQLESSRELGMKYLAPGFEPISLEAAQRILAIDRQRVKDGKGDLREARAEIARLEVSAAKLSHLPRAITPVIFSFRESTPLRDLLASEVHVAFDLDGFGGTNWSWLQPSTGILVWDPERTGAIRSGLQLFGNVTWWMFWRDGFQALAALDDDRDGWLSGAELAGIAVWMDRNQNGKSEPGEVVSLRDAGIVRIGVTAALDSDGTLGNPRGMEFSDGRQTPAYDWIATGSPSSGRERPESSVKQLR